MYNLGNWQDDLLSIGTSYVAGKQSSAAAAAADLDSRMETQLPMFMRAWPRGSSTAKAALLRAASAANAAGKWARAAEVEADPSGFVLAANGGSDGKISTDKGRQFNALFLSFLQQYGGTDYNGETNTTGGTGSNGSNGTNGSAIADNGAFTLTLPAWLADALTPQPKTTTGGNAANVGGVSVPVLPLAAGALALVLFLRRPRGRR